MHGNIIGNRQLVWDPCASDGERPIKIFGIFFVLGGLHPRPHGSLCACMDHAGDRTHFFVRLRNNSWLRPCLQMPIVVRIITVIISQPDYLHNLISVQSTGRTRYSSLVTLARPSVSSSLQITNRSFTYASP